MHIAFAGGHRFFPARLPGDGLQPVQEAGRHRGRAAGLRGMAEDHVLGAKQLGKIMRGKADAPLGQIEAKLMPHRAA